MRNRIVFSLLLLGSLVVRPVLAATITVTTTADSGTGSLRQAIALAASGDTIDFAVSGSILLTSGELLINKSLVIAGPGASALTISRNTAAGTPNFRIFNFQSGIVTLSDLSLSNGREIIGGAINNEHATLMVRDCVIIGD